MIIDILSLIDYYPPIASNSLLDIIMVSIKDTWFTLILLAYIGGMTGIISMASHGVIYCLDTKYPIINFVSFILILLLWPIVFIFIILFQKYR